ncbi:MAG: 2OG-Fe(II) oxygenase [Gammaproteobacteria bacterium]
MKRIEIQSEGANPDFIGGWIIDPLTICDELIEFFEAHRQSHTQGKMAGGLNLDSKKSTDLSIRPNELDSPGHEPVRNYLQTLFTCYRDYLEQWPFLKGFLQNSEVGPFNIQRYDPSGHFQKIHSERTTLATAHRVFAWMTYLNDVEDGGETHFVYQQLDVQPQKGKTLIWPAEWTHAHQGKVVNSGQKYIITGWIHFAPPPAPAG